LHAGIYLILENKGNSLYTIDEIAILCYDRELLLVNTSANKTFIHTSKSYNSLICFQNSSTEIQ